MNDKSHNHLPKIPLAVCLLLMWLNPLFATNYYVSKQGNDSNPGTKELPFLTLIKASGAVWPGDTCFVMEGTYRETLIVGRSGSADFPIVFKAYENDSVVISATEVLAGWQEHQGTLYKTAASMTMGRQDMLYFNGQAMDWARWPNNTDGNPFTIDASPIEGGTASSIMDTDIPDLDWTGAYMWYLGAHSGASWTRPVTGYSPSTHTLFFEAVDINKWPFNPHNPTVYRNGNHGRIFLFGVMDALDHPGEWYFDRDIDTLYFQAPANADPTINLTEISKRINTLQISGKHIHIDGIHAFGGRILITGDHCVLRNGTFRHCLEILDELDNSDAQMFDGSIKLEGSNALIENNTIEYGSSNGISILASWKGSRDNTIRNNIIRHFNTLGIHSCGIRSNCPGTKIIGNTISHCGRDGIYLSGSNGEIAFNDVSACMQINNDGGVFYTVGNQSEKNTTIHHNWFHDSFGPSYADGRAAGIYLDNDSKGYDVHHNVVWNVTWTAVQMNWDNWYNDIFNNSFWNVGGAMGNWLNGRELIGNRIYNNYSSVSPWVGNDFEANIISPESPFNDVGNLDFTPKKGSDLINQGMLIPGITTQVMGDAPDVGAYEYGISPWIPGINYNPGGDTLSNLKIDFAHPGPDQVFALPADVLVEALNVNGEEGVVMSLYLDEEFISMDSMAPFRWDPAEFSTLSGLSTGRYILTIEATDANDYAYTTSTSFQVVPGRAGDTFVLGNTSGLEGVQDPWTTNMVINLTDNYTNLSDTTIFLVVNSFNFYAQDQADPVTPFIVEVRGEDDFKVKSVGETRDSTAYEPGSNAFSFKSGVDTILAISPGESVATGFLDAFADGSGGGSGSVIPFDELEPADQLWYSGGPNWYYSGSISEGSSPVYQYPPRTFYRRNYWYQIGFTITDSLGTSIKHHRLPREISISIFPNPVDRNHFTLGIPDFSDAAEICIFDLHGALIYTQQVHSGFTQLSSSILPHPGTYVVRIRSNGDFYFRKLIKL